jgi:hypothetical protein
MGTEFLIIELLLPKALTSLRLVFTKRTSDYDLGTCIPGK